MTDDRRQAPYAEIPSATKTYMVMKRIRLPLMLISFVLIGGCETVVDVAQPPHEAQLVAQSFFAPGSPWVVRVTNTVAYSAAEAPGPIEDATVEIWDAGTSGGPIATVEANHKGQFDYRGDYYPPPCAVQISVDGYSRGPIAVDHAEGYCEGSD